jgi:hypothetical protein
MHFTNNTDIPLGLAVWLLHDTYDYSKEENYISVTSLMKPIKQTILGSRVTKADQSMDVSELVASSMGTALHDSIEKAWLKNHKVALAKLGYPTNVVERVLVNPTKEELAKTNEPIAIYIEQRTVRKIDGWSVGGKYDMVMDGVITDNKSTSAYSWLYGTKDDDHRIQLSLYRWLNPEIVTEDFGRINYIFTDWQKAAAATNPKYPQKRLESKELTLLSKEESEQWVKVRLRTLKEKWDKPEMNLPECTDEELWRSEPKYKYYKDPAKTDGRSTKNFDSLQEANAFKAEKGVGVVLTIKGEPKRCGYCLAYDLCKQKDKYFND